MSASNDQIYAAIERIERRQDEHHSENRKSLEEIRDRVKELELDKAKRSGAKAAIAGLVALITSTGLWALLSDLFTRHGGKQ